MIINLVKLPVVVVVVDDDVVDWETLATAAAAAFASIEVSKW